MIIRKIAASVALLCLIALAATAAKLPFRGGEILSAEISSRRPAIANFDPVDFPDTFSNKRYAALVVKMASERGLSIYDYSLEILGVSYPCVAIRMDDAGFDAAPDKREIARTSPYRTYTLLFIVNGGFVGLQPRENLSLHCIAPSNKRSLQEVPFENIGDRPFARPSTIPAAGIVASRETR